VLLTARLVLVAMLAATTGLTATAATSATATVLLLVVHGGDNRLHRIHSGDEGTLLVMSCQAVSSGRQGTQIQMILLRQHHAQLRREALEEKILHENTVLLSARAKLQHTAQ
jgi:hypothetical protein